METRLNKEQEQLFTLYEKGFFADLTKEEQVFVLSQTTPEAFDQVHLVWKESKAIYDVPKARPLVLPAAEPSRFRSTLISFTSAAAAAILTFFFFRKETIVVQTVDKPIYLSSDTVYIKEKTVDTVYEYAQDEIRYVQDKPIERPNIEVTELVKSNEVVPPLTTLDLKNKGESMRKDKLVGLMDGVVY